MRILKRVLFLLPTISTGLVRLLQLAILLILSNVGTGADRNLLVAGFGLLSSFAMMTDSGAGNFLLSTPLGEISRSVYRKAVAFHLGLAALGSVLAILFIAVPAGGYIPPTVLVLLVCFAVTQSLDSTGRIIRAPLMVAKRDAVYAAPDVVLLVLKLPILAAAFLQSDLTILLLLPIPSLVVAVVTFVSTDRALVAIGVDEHRIYRRILEFGATGALSAFYSQSPLLIASTLLPLDQLATLTIVYRIIQALDLVPGTLSLQLIPRIRGRATGPWTYWTGFFLGGLVIAGVVVASLPIIELMFGHQFSDVWVFVLVALSFAPKSGNYALVAYLMGSGQIRTRLVLTVAAAAVSLGLSVTFALIAGATGLAAVTLTVELLFALGGFFALKRLALKPARIPISDAQPENVL
ncbi:polysaccharide transporter [Cryobacterium adonitolivorans]|uniref:Polysaccharide transporter n=1 Tax=Cryobacterium adonitolivorans TaxID=1259189 RepID=A0A4R8W1P0_9MICO|nr:polysaccharide transporter [Cryobacterium adonitolivorans]TFB96811.1 polysaccharide transporter [Cryobacterium adonitolivorans]